jgi:uncharacterized RDD family membrane protein YckC
LLLYLQESAATLEGIAPEEAVTATPYILMTLGTIVNFGLNVYLTSAYGGTVGKRLVGTVVLDRESKAFLSYGKSALREGLRFFLCNSGILKSFCCLLGLVCIWLLFDSERRQVYDIILGSNVYEKAS